jgi:nicotinate-nucleotide adenylyltransferase
MYLTLDTWHEPETVFSLASIALFARETDRWEEIQRKTDEYQLRFGSTLYIIPGEPVEVSSTQLRALLPQRQGVEYLPEGVYSYILQHRLYGARPNFLWLRTAAYAYLKEKRIPHVQGTEQEAIRLAERWGLSTEDAAEAAICHDITKKLELDDQLRLCDKYGIMIDDMERVSEKLLHAKTGAVFAQDLFGLSDTVADAIRWHTTGRAGMTTLQQIIYLADYIEPHREGFDGLEELRQAAYTDLDQAMELGMRMTLQDVRARGYESHPDTLTGHAWFMQRLADKGIAPIHAPGVDDNIE